ncbi:MAG: glycosyl transferase [Oscillospiraceae bacterium]|nr:glycosyl transferase [Oscillospiraceae bacterium]
MIPKIIHYCWFGGNPKPKLAEKCIASWKKHCPGWQIIEWNESNFDVNQNDYTKMCIEQKKYAFLSDYVRLKVVAEQGGVYFDTDVELLRPIDDLLTNEAFFGFEAPEYVASGLGFGSAAHGTVIEAMLREYDFLLDGTQGVRGCPELNTAALEKLGLVKDGSMQQVAGAKILPIEYLNPLESATGRLRKTKNTYSVHWYNASWMTWQQKLRGAITRPLHRIFGVDCFKWLKK